MRSTAQLFLDRLAIGASIVCALHCAVLPILLAVFPALVALPIGDHEFHQMMIWVVIPSSMIAVSLGCWRHKDLLVLAGGATGLMVIVTTALFGHDILGETGEKVATLAGALILATAHWRNFSLCRKDCCSHDHGA